MVNTSFICLLSPYVVSLIIHVWSFWLSWLFVPGDLFGCSGCQLLIFKKKKGFLKRFQFLKKRFYHEKKRFFLHRQFQILELKNRFCFKKKKGIFHRQFPTLLQASLGLPKIRGSPGQPLAHFSKSTRWRHYSCPQTEGIQLSRGLPN